jgi:hypothetical protein
LEAIVIKNNVGRPMKFFEEISSDYRTKKLKQIQKTLINAVEIVLSKESDEKFKITTKELLLKGVIWDFFNPCK